MEGADLEFRDFPVSVQTTGCRATTKCPCYYTRPEVLTLSLMVLGPKMWKRHELSVMIDALDGLSPHLSVSHGQYTGHSPRGTSRSQRAAQASRVSRN